MVRAVKIYGAHLKAEAPASAGLVVGVGSLPPGSPGGCRALSRGSPRFAAFCRGPDRKLPLLRWSSANV